MRPQLEPTAAESMVASVSTIAVLPVLSGGGVGWGNAGCPLDSRPIPHPLTVLQALEPYWSLWGQFAVFSFPSDRHGRHPAHLAGAGGGPCPGQMFLGSAGTRGPCRPGLLVKVQRE